MKPRCFVNRAVIFCLIAAVAASGDSFSFQSCESFEREVRDTVLRGELSLARWKALHFLDQVEICKDKIVAAYQDASDEFYSEKDFLKRILHASAESRRTVVVPNKEECSSDLFFNDNGEFVNEKWDRCCSLLPWNNKYEQKRRNFFAELPDVCEISLGSASHLRLPAINEPSLRLRIGSTVLYIEQEGYLRPFDVAGILWPSGFLLSQCLADAMACHPLLGQHLQRLSTDDSPVAIELGAGIGVASITLLSQLGAYQVLATDTSPHSWALTLSNAMANNVSVLVDHLNHTNVQSLTTIRQEYRPKEGFLIVMGSSLQLLFQNTSSSDAFLWKALDVLLADRGIGVFAHTATEALQHPADGRYSLMTRISGDQYDMKTRGGTSSDFEIVVFQRRLQRARATSTSRDDEF